MTAYLCGDTWTIGGSEPPSTVSTWPTKSAAREAYRRAFGYLPSVSDRVRIAEFDVERLPVEPSEHAPVRMTVEPARKLTDQIKHDAAQLEINGVGVQWSETSNASARTSSGPAGRVVFVRPCCPRWASSPAT